MSLRRQGCPEGVLAWSGGIARIVPEWAESRCRLVHDEKGGSDVRWVQHRKPRENLEEPVSPRGGEGVVCGEQECKGIKGRQVTASHSAESQAGRLSGHCSLKDKCEGLLR